MNIKDERTLPELQAAMLAGDITARDTVIDRYTYLCAYCVRETIGARKVKKEIREEAEGAALLALVAGANALMEKAAENTETYLQTVIRNAVATELWNQGAISIPSRTGFRDGNTEEIVFDELNNSIQDRATVTCPGELWEELLACCKDETDQKIIQALADGQTTEEVAAYLDIALRTVNHRRDTVRARYEERNETTLPARKSRLKKTTKVIDEVNYATAA